jgi:hypothetical protein
MMSFRTPETCWAVHKRQVINLRNCCIWLVDLFGMRQGVSMRKPTYMFLFQNFILIIHKQIWVRYVPYTSLTTRDPSPLGSFPHHLLNR